MLRRRSVLCGLLLSVLLGGGLGKPQADAEEPKPLLVFAAASLKTALDGAILARESDSREPVIVSYAATSALARQIEAGAPADIMIAADTEWMDYLDARALIDPESRSNLLSNALVLIAPSGASAQSPLPVALVPGVDLAARLGNGRLAVAETSAVPAGRYAKAALMTLGSWSSLESRLAEVENVRAALMLVARGETPLGIVYRTDALDEPAVQILATFPDGTHPPILYPAARVSASVHPASEAFLAYLRSEEGAAVFARHGFTPPD
jgi:molybdate transport system substrate-binding protein